MRSTASAKRWAALPLLVLATATRPVAALAEPVQAAGPAGAVGGVSSPASGTLALAIEASDGEGLVSATATLEGAPPVTLAFGGEGCAQLAHAVREGGSSPPEPPGPCPAYVEASAPIDTTTVADGPHELTVSVTNLAGTTATILGRTILVENHPASEQSSVTIAFGSGGVGSGEGGSGGAGGSGSAGGAGESGRGETLGYKGEKPPACAAPRLSMMLSQRPLRLSRGVVVLRDDRAYRYKGLLTCVRDGRRRRAPAGTVIDVGYRLRKRLVARSGTTVRRSGAISVLIACPSSRTIVFRLAGSTARDAVVRIPVKVVGPLHGRRVEKTRVLAAESRRRGRRR